MDPVEGVSNRTVYDYDKANDPNSPGSPTAVQSTQASVVSVDGVDPSVQGLSVTADDNDVGSLPLPDVQGPMLGSGRLDDKLGWLAETRGMPEASLMLLVLAALKEKDERFEKVLSQSRLVQRDLARALKNSEFKSTRSKIDKMREVAASSKRWACFSAGVGIAASVGGAALGASGLGGSETAWLSKGLGEGLSAGGGMAISQPVSAWGEARRRGANGYQTQADKAELQAQRMQLASKEQDNAAEETQRVRDVMARAKERAQKIRELVAEMEREANRAAVNIGL